MNEPNPTPPESLRDAWMESLLESAYVAEDHSARIERAIEGIEPESITPAERQPSPRTVSWLRWSPLGIAAAICLTLFLFIQYGGTQKSAQAAIKRSLAVAAEPTARKYRLVIDYRPVIGESRVTENVLYVQGNDHFAMQHAGPLPGTRFWLGRNGEESWVVPAIGPVFKGNRALLGNWLSGHEDVDTPYLHVTTLLNRMSSGYDLSVLPDTKLNAEQGKLTPCLHIRAQRNLAKLDEAGRDSAEAREFPETIELWASRESGIAIRVVARWQLKEGEVGRRSLELTFAEEVHSLSRDWFRAEGHYDGYRPIIQTDLPLDDATTVPDAPP